jgi:hypothetical protein
MVIGRRNAHSWLRNVLIDPRRRRLARRAGFWRWLAALAAGWGGQK